MAIVETTVRVTRERIERKHTKKSLISLTSDCRDFFLEIGMERNAKYLNSLSQTKHSMSWNLFYIYDDLYNCLEDNKLSEKQREKASELAARIAWGY